MWNKFLFLIVQNKQRDRMGEAGDSVAGNQSQSPSSVMGSFRDFHAEKPRLLTVPQKRIQHETKLDFIIKWFW